MALIYQDDVYQIGLSHGIDVSEIRDCISATLGIPSSSITGICQAIQTGELEGSSRATVYPLSILVRIRLNFFTLNQENNV